MDYILKDWIWNSNIFVSDIVKKVFSNRKLGAKLSMQTEVIMALQW
jgi:hypothetical protein